MAEREPNDQDQPRVTPGPVSSEPGSELEPPARPSVPAGEEAGFTLLEVLIAVAIMAVVLTSMMGSQLDAMQATRYARDITAAALLAEYQIVELEWQSRKDGWVSADVELDGDFSDQGWDDMKWRCTVHFIELPEYNELIDSKQGADEAAGDDDNVVDAGDQAFGALGMVWPIVKTAIENSIRKVDCTISWQSGEITQEFEIQTFWTDPAALLNLPGAGGEFKDEDDDSGTQDPSSTGTGTGSGRPPSKGGPAGAMKMGGG